MFEINIRFDIQITFISLRLHSIFKLLLMHFAYNITNITNLVHIALKRIIGPFTNYKTIQKALKRFDILVKKEIIFTQG